MIDLSRIKRSPAAGRIIIEVLLNAPAFLLILYGLMCLATSHGLTLLPSKVIYRSRIHLVSIDGAGAFALACQYIGLGLFLYFSDGSPPPEERPWLWRIGRGLLRWGSLFMAVFCYWEVYKGLPGGNFPANVFPPFFMARIIVFISCPIALWLFFNAMFQREQVKRELAERSCQPSRIWWIPAAYWVPWGTFRRAVGFRVVYADPEGIVHKGYCFVYRSFLRDWGRGNRSVRWLADTATESGQ